MAQDSTKDSNILIDIAFLAHILLLLPAASFIYLALTLTRTSPLVTAAGITVIWAALIPYPVWWYWQRRIR